MTPGPLLLCLFLLVTAFCPMTAAAPLALAPIASRGSSRILVEPSSASLAGGKARLTTSALRRDGSKYIGDYQLKVTPYFFKSETGTLAVGVSDDSLARLTAGEPVSFAGSAITNGSKKRRVVTVKALPSATGSPKGTLTMAIDTENGELLFKSSYALSGD